MFSKIPRFFYQTINDNTTVDAILAYFNKQWKFKNKKVIENNILEWMELIWSKLKLPLSKTGSYVRGFYCFYMKWKTVKLRDETWRLTSTKTKSLSKKRWGFVLLAKGNKFQGQGPQLAAFLTTSKSNCINVVGKNQKQNLYLRS